MTKRKHPRSSELSWCLRELTWLESAQHDDTVSVEEWRRRGNALLERSGKLTSADQEAYHQAWENFQRREGTYLAPLPDENPAGHPDQVLIDQEAARRIAEILESHHAQQS